MTGMDQGLQQLREPAAGLGERFLARFARTPDEIVTAQRLRYSVFYEEMDARPSSAARASQRDADAYDEACDHLIVVRAHAGPSGRFAVAGGDMVGTYRLLAQGKARSCGGFYTQGEFDIAALTARKPELNFLELGRSCVLKAYRTRAIIDLLWRGIWDHVRANRFDVMFGCASFAGADAAPHADILDYLARHHAPPAEWHVAALPEKHIAMRSSSGVKPDARALVRRIPPLIKGYLRLGCFIGDGAVVDLQFNTTDVLIILPVTRINPRYFAHFGQPNVDHPLNSAAALNNRA
jgi:L-ornithine Nalpha-acyltransferase